ncbi:MAG: hypothetical protein QNJ45_20180 [Ardenticatenaceae bacterium]|nr:hypothetical protein [Ardenticatenaceae bacterium]
MSKVEIYEYPQTIKLVSRFIPFAIVGAYIALLFLPLISDEISVNPSRFLIIILIAGPIALLFATSIHFMYPEVHVSGEQFKLKTAFYESRWLRWDQIQDVALPESRLVSQIVTVVVRDLPIIYWFIGLTRGFWGPAFLIHSRMRNGSRLVRRIYNKRGDLFSARPQ